MVFQHNTYGIGIAGEPYDDNGQMQIKVKFKGVQKPVTFLYPWAIEKGILREVTDPVTISKPVSKHSTINRQALADLIEKYITDFLQKKHLPFVVNPSVPIIWFGDLEQYERSPKRILTVSLNPSKEEFPQTAERPRFESVDLSACNAHDTLFATLNRYFKINPYRWFHKYNVLLDALDCSYGGTYGMQTNTAIHIDIYSAIATDPTWSGLSSHEKELIQNATLFDELFKLLDPDIVFVSVNQDVFQKHFSTWHITHTFSFAGHNTITGYINQNRKLICGTNCKGVPFGAIPTAEAKQKILEIAGASNLALAEMETSVERNRVYDIIISLLNGIKNGDVLKEEAGGRQTILQGCSYLLNQTIRQLQLPNDHYFVSKKAQELWSKLSTDSIFNYAYRDKVIKNVDGDVLVDKYRGSERKPYESERLSRGNSFTFNDVFTDEHIVTVSNIRDELLALPEYNYASIGKILDKIYICKILKSEDHAIANKKNRPTDYREVIVFDYKNAGIDVVGFDYKTELETMIEEKKTLMAELEKEKAKTTPVPTTAVSIKTSTSYCASKDGIGETFKFTNSKPSKSGNREAYRAFNAVGEEVGYVFATYDKPVTSIGYAELYFYSRYKGKTYHRFTTNGTKLHFDVLRDILKTKGEYTCYID